MKGKERGVMARVDMESLSDLVSPPVGGGQTQGKVGAVRSED